MSEATFSLMRTREEAVAAVKALQDKGWSIYAANAPLTGQVGFKCVTNIQEEGVTKEQAHCVFWNIFDTELTPIVLECLTELDLLSFLWTHANHDTFGFFAYPESHDVGFACYCRGDDSKSLVLHIADETELNEDACELIWAYQCELENEESEDDEEFIVDGAKPRELN